MTPDDSEVPTQTRVEPAYRGPEPGVVLKGRYRIEQELGRGGIGAVYLARDQDLENRRVVVKVLLDTSAGDDWVQRKFQDEMRALVRLDHPGIVAALDVGLAPDGKPFLVMQHVAGRTLRQRLAEAGRPTAAEVADVVRQAASALAAAHARGIYHRDLKPENVMLQALESGERLVKIIDFGIATVKASSEAETARTRVAGTVLYMAPEQLAGRPSASSDTYALAVIAHEMLTGALPFRPASPYELLSMQREGLRLRPSQANPTLPPACDEVLIRALAYEPADRHASAREFAEALAAALAGDGAESRPTTRIAPPVASRPPAKSRRLLLSATAVVALLAAGYLALVWRPATPTFVPRASPAPAIESLPELEFRYALLVQRYRAGQPYREPFRLPGPMLFGVDDGIRLIVSSPQPGHLYVLNQGPDAETGEETLHVLFPSPTANGGSSRLASGQEASVPERSWFRFDEAQGTERLWLVWAAAPVAVLEAVKAYANPEDRGRIADPEHLRQVRAFVNERARGAVLPDRDEAALMTRLRGRAEVLLARVDLEHR